MASQAHRGPVDVAHPMDAVVRVELARILSSELFARSDRLTSFLKFIVEQTLDGHGESLKEQVLACEVYGKGADFNTAADPIVRVDARRLRDKLREYYISAPHDPVIISVRKGSYTPLFETNAPMAPPLDQSRHPSPRAPAGSTVVMRRRWSRASLIGAGSITVGAIALTFAAFRVVSRPEAPPMRLLTATSFPGSEGVPSLSPDGNFVAFVWGSPTSNRLADLWVKAVDGDALRRLTDTPLFNETWAAWSPDGQQIAFSRRDGGVSAGVYVVSPLGGPEQKLSDAVGTSPAWTPDSQSLVVGDRMPNGTAIFQHILRNGARRQLTWPSSGFDDRFPGVSPDGKMLAFVRWSRGDQAALFLVPMAGGDAARRTDWSPGIGSVTWTPDGRDILYSQADTSGIRIFRIAALGSGKGAIVPGIPIGVNSASVSQERSDHTFRLAVGYGQPDIGLRLIDLEAAVAAGGISSVKRFCDAARIDAPGRFSRDGARVAFTSDRSGNQQIWVADRNESGIRRLTTLEGASVNAGSWSPDGRSLALDAVVGGNTDVYVVSDGGGPLKRLTDAPARESDPEWSRDGRWIYYASDASGRSEIWRMPAAGGTSVQLTTHGGFEPREASDGRTIYYVDKVRRNPFDTIASIKQVPAAGGPEAVVFSGVTAGAWDITDTGIVFLTGDPGRASSDGTADAVNVYAFADRRSRRIGELPFAVTRTGVSRLLTVSRDGRWALGSHIDSWERDVLVADHFR